jgi:hypothetical protein
MRLAHPFLWAAMMLALATPAHAQQSARTQWLYENAFNPERQFAGDEPLFGPLMTAVYRGDDYEVPVFSLSIAEACKNGAQKCDAPEKALIARLVRAPLPADEVRPRAAGYALLAKLKKAGGVRDALDQGAVEWLETPLSSCPGAGVALESVRNANWSVDADSDLSALNGEADSSDILLHFDTMLIGFRNSYTQRTSYEGSIEDHAKIEGEMLGDDDDGIHVTAATLRFIKVIEPCLKKSAAIPPWHRSHRRQRS